MVGSGVECQKSTAWLIDVLLNFLRQLHCAQTVPRWYQLIRLIVLFLLLSSVFVQIDASEKEYQRRILALLQHKLLLHRQIGNIWKNDGINVCQRTVFNVKRKVGLQRNSVEKMDKRSVSTPSIVFKSNRKNSCRRFSISTFNLIASVNRLSPQLENPLIFFFVKNVEVHKLTLSTPE